MGMDKIGRVEQFFGDVHVTQFCIDFGSGTHLRAFFNVSEPFFEPVDFHPIGIFDMPHRFRYPQPHFGSTGLFDMLGNHFKHRHISFAA